MKRWLKLSIITTPVLVDAITDFLVGVIDAGVEVGVDEHIALKTLNVYVEKENPTATELEETVTQVENHLRQLAGIFQVEVPDLSWEEFEEEDWGKNWKKYFVPFVIADGLVVAPSWEEYQPEEGERVLVMDPGMAFGTGHHATTALALTLLREAQVRSSKISSVLDVGTGTGILGMAAALFGAKNVLGIDNDPVAVSTAAENIAKNNLSGVMQVSHRPLRQIESRYSAVLANIVHDVLIEMAEELHTVTEAGGILILSGILEGEQVDSISAVYENLGFSLREQRLRDGWAALLYEKRE